MNAPIIEVKNVGKKYFIGEKQEYLALRDVLANIFKSPMRWLKTKTVDYNVGGQFFWALKNLNFTVKQGEILGIIGRNGAGKSTLLKILSQITPPTTGEIKIRGRVGSILEVGAGFHLELTGRDNIFINGAILGMRRREILSKFDRIVDFAGISKFLDMPVKRYSSGMQVRLAFAIAAHLEPEILIVDEVFAVGDAEFQKKCLGKIAEVTEKDGRTVLFVSHSMSIVQKLCKKSILLNKGEIIKEGDTGQVVDFYLNNSNISAVIEFNSTKNKKVSIDRISILDCKHSPASRIPVSSSFTIKVDYVFTDPMENLLFTAIFYSDNDEVFLYSSESDKKGSFNNYSPGRYSTTIKIPPFLFNVGNYHFDIGLQSRFGYLESKNHISFEIVDVDNPKSTFRSDYLLGKSAFMLDYDTNKLN